MSDEQFTLTMSPTIGKLAAAMAKAQLEMKPAEKDGKNPHFNNRYATLVSCIEACRPLHENEIAVLQPPVPHGLEGVCVATLLVHSSGEWIRGELFLPATKKDAQGFGSALSYARRYCLQSTLNMGADDDDGDQATKAPPRQASAPRKANPPPPPKSGDLARQLEASVANDGDWHAWAAGHLSSMRAASKRGTQALLEAWSSVNDDIKKMNPPMEHVQALKLGKDELKEQLQGTGS